MPCDVTSKHLQRNKPTAARQQPPSPGLAAALPAPPAPQPSDQVLHACRKDTVDMEERCQLLFSLLDAELRQIALWRLEGHTNEEIAEMTNHLVSWVERKFRIIRKLWANAVL